MATCTDGNGTTYLTRKIKGTSLHILVAQEEGCEDRVEFTTSAEDAESQMAGVMAYLSAYGEAQEEAEVEA